jgi:uncharacterized protein (DUF58 family)
MKRTWEFIKAIYLNNLLFALIGVIIALYILGFFIPFVYEIATPALMGVVILTVADAFLVFTRGEVNARRETMDKLSNGDYNPVRILLRSSYPFPVSVDVIDELPVQLQARDIRFTMKLLPGKRKLLEYKVRPTKRGAYGFGAVNVFVSSPLKLISKRFRFSEHATVPVYPSFMQMRKYELMAISNRLTEVGIKKIRKIGQNTEFDQIKEYVSGDDYRVINWKATARKGKLMVNQFQDERSQQVYNVIDMGRLMKMPFDELSLLDYAINSSLVISNIAMYKQDKAGIITFSHKVQGILPASRRSNQLSRILEMLYNQKTGYLEADFERLLIETKKKITTRSLMLLYTNFESLSGMRRQLAYLRALSKDHLLVVIFFENTEMKQLIEEPAKKVRTVYAKTIAEKFVYEKRQIVMELKKYGIHTILTTPENLTVNSINKYLELKSRGLI